MNPGKLCSIAVLLLCALLVLTVLPSGTSAEDTPAEKTFVSEGAEEPTFEEWNAQWTKYDNNAASSYDTWCRTPHRANSGTFGIYCAKSGYNTHYLNSSGVQPYNWDILNAGNNSNPADLVQRYDTNQDSVMRKYVNGAKFYGTITMSFWFYSDTGASDAKQPSDGTNVGYDFLNAFYYTGSNSSLEKHVVWTMSQEQASAKGWNQVTLTLPNTLTWVGFEFVSGTVAPSGGDPVDAFLSNGIFNNPQWESAMKEGVYIDDISVVGTDAIVAGEIVTSVDDLAPYQTSSSFSVNLGNNDPLGQRLDWTYLWYRLNGSSEWTKYTTADKPKGAFITSPVTFEATQDGTYEFFTQGKDKSGRLEVKRNVADASTVVDTVLPTSTLDMSGELSGGSYVGAAVFALSAADGASGIDQIMYRIDNGAWTAYSEPVGVSTSGTHTLQYYAKDKAGNTEATHENVFTVSSGGPTVVFQNADNAFSEGNVTLDFMVVSDKDIVKLEYALDNGEFQQLEPTATKVALSGLTGTHSLQVRATDASGVVLTNDATFHVGEGSPDTMSSLLGNPLLIGGLVVAAVALVGAALLIVRRRK